MPGLIGAIQASLTGLRVNETRQLATSNNVANVVTTGFRASDVHASSLNPTRDVPGQGALARPRTDVAVRAGLTQTGRNTNLAIGGNGFFLVTDARGDQFLTRDGSFQPDANGNLVNAAGFTLQGIALDADGRETGRFGPVNVAGTQGPVTVDGNGSVSVVDPDGQSRAAFRVPVATVPNQNGLAASSGNVFSETALSGAPTFATAGQSGAGDVISGALEGSNVRLDRELSDTIVTRTAFSANLNTVRAASRMIDSILDIKT